MAFAVYEDCPRGLDYEKRFIYGHESVISRQFPMAEPVSHHSSLENAERRALALEAREIKWAKANMTACFSYVVPA
jgi:hypothetical protein